MTVTVIEQDSIWRRAALFLNPSGWERDDHGRIRRGRWMATFSGGKVWVLDPRADEIVFDDLCIGLAREWRFGRQTIGPYSVATHSVLVSMYCEQHATELGWSPGEIHEVACEALLHDAAEAYLGDVPRPLKRERAMRGYKKVEDLWWTAICKRFSLRPTRQSTALVKSVETRLLIDEINSVMRDPSTWWRARRYEGVEPLGAAIPCATWEQSAYLFASRFAELFPEESPTLDDCTSDQLN